MGFYASMDWVNKYMMDMESQTDANSSYINRVLDVVVHIGYRMAQEVIVVCYNIQEGTWTHGGDV